MRSLATFGIGVMALITLFTVITHPAYASVLILSTVLAIVLSGWVMRPQGSFARVALAPVSTIGVMPRYEGREVGESYPQILVFRIILKNLYLLGLPILASAGVLMWMFASGPRSAIHEAWDNPVILYLVGYGSVPIFIIAASWFRERWLMSRGLVVLGGIALTATFGGIPQYRYEFIAPDGERYGGTYRSKFFRPEGTNCTPVLVDKDNFERHSPVTVLKFHRFELVDRHHLAISKSSTAGT